MIDASDQRARQRAVAAPGSVLVQAPAGSGKTTLLVQRYLRLLSVVDAPERILALTFTRRAAEEMRARVLSALRAAGLDRCPEKFSEETWNLAVTARRHMHSLNLDIERQPSRLRIETIDAFNAWLAGQLPITAGAGAAIPVLADPAPCYEEAARRTLAYEEGPFGAAVDQVLAIDDQRWQRLRNLIAEMLPTRDRWLRLLAGRLQAASALDEEQLLHVRQQLDEDLGLLLSRVMVRARSVLGEILHALPPLLHGAARRAGAELPQLAAWAKDGSPLRAEMADLARWRGAAHLLLTGAGKIRGRVTKNEGFPPKCADKQPMMDLLGELDRHPQARQILRELRGLPEAAYNDEQWILGRPRSVDVSLKLRF